MEESASDLTYLWPRDAEETGAHLECGCDSRKARLVDCEMICRGQTRQEMYIGRIDAELQLFRQYKSTYGRTRSVGFVCRVKEGDDKGCRNRSRVLLVVGGRSYPGRLGCRTQRQDANDDDVETSRFSKSSRSYRNTMELFVSERSTVIAYLMKVASLPAGPEEAYRRPRRRLSVPAW